jgi:tetratricopeptide (TPR) repeat protein
VEPVVLAIPAKNEKNEMRKLIVILFICLPFLFLGCSNRKIAEKHDSKWKSTKQVTDTLSEKNKVDFERFFIEGLRQKMNGKTDDAIQYFNSCLQIDPKSAVVLYELARIHAAKGDYSSAKPLLENAIALNPENKWYNILLAQLYQNNKQYTEASKIYSNLIKLNPDIFDFYLLKAINLASAENYEEAIKAYLELEEKFGFNEQIYVAREQLYRALGKNKEAYGEIEKLIKSDPSVPDYYVIMADMFKFDGNKEKALEYYNKVLEIDPDNGFIHFSLAAFYLQNNDLEKAFDQVKTGFLNPNVEIENKIQLYLMLVTSPSEKKLSNEQIEELVNIMITVHPNDSRSYSIYADFYIQHGKYDEAREYLRKSLKIDPNSYSFWEQLVLLDNQVGDFQNMETESEKAIELFPSQPLLYVLNSISLIQAKAYEKALKSLETGQNYVVDKKMEAQYELYKAEAYYNLNKRNEAFASFDKVIEIEPDNFVALNNYAYYLSVQGEQLDKAESMSSRVVLANPDNATYLDTHAWVLFKRKEYKLAKHYIETALSNGGNLNDVIVEHYGDILFMLEDVDGAVSNWNKSKELGNQSEILQKKIDEKRFIEGNE